MIESLRKFFHTDKLIGKIIFVLFTYIILWCIFYGSWLIMPEYWFDEAEESTGKLFLILLYIIIPFFSFKIPKFIKKVVIISNTFLYTLHVFLLILFLALFSYLGILQALSNFQIG